MFIALCGVIFLAGVLAFVISDAGGHTGGDLGCGNFHDAVAKFCALPGGDGNSHKGQEDAVGAENLAKLFFPHIQRRDLAVVDDGAQSRAGQGHFRMGIFPLEVIHMEGTGQRILSEIGQAQKSRESNTAHAAPKSPLLCVKTIGPHTLVA